jgi:hypothetical protein
MQFISHNQWYILVLQNLYLERLNRIVTDNCEGPRLVGMPQILLLLKLDNQFWTPIVQPSDNLFALQLTDLSWLLYCYSYTLIGPADKYIAGIDCTDINT